MTPLLTYMTWLSTKPDAPLKANEMRMLEAVTLPYHLGNPIKVLPTMKALPEISTTTAHGMLTNLQNKGWLKLRHDKNDKRIKYVEPTKKTTKYFEEAGKAMAEALGVL